MTEELEYEIHKLKNATKLLAKVTACAALVDAHNKGYDVPDKMLDEYIATLHDVAQENTPEE